MTLHISYAVILVTLIVSQILRRRNDAENRLFLLILIFMVLSSGARLSFVLSNRYLQGRLCDILDLFSTLCGCALFPLFFAYILYDTGKRRLADQGFRRMIMISAVISAAFFLAAAVSMAYGSQHRLSVFGLNDISLNHLDILLCRITQYTLITSFVISRKGAGMARRKAVIAFCLLMIAAAVFDIFTVRYDISHLFATSTALGIYLNFQQEAEIRKEAMELELINTRLSLILGKIRPDFVLATLEEIEKLCMEDAEEAQSAISLLSDYLRGNIDRIDTNDVILFTDELEHIQNYIGLVQLCGHDVILRYDLSFKSFRVPGRSVLPLVEQFVNDMTCEERTSEIITIASRKEDGAAIVEVSGPARTLHHDMNIASEQYKTISFRLSRFKGSKLILYCDMQKQLHAVLRFPPEKKEALS